MSLTIALETCTIIVEIFDGKRYRADWSYAVFISKLTGQVLRLTIPQLVTALDNAAKEMRESKEMRKAR